MIRQEHVLVHTRAGDALQEYKVRAFESGDSKAGITQTDLYQMVSYGLRRSSQHVVLLYPRPFGREPELPQRFTVNSGLLDKQPIHIRAVDLTVTGSMKTLKEFNEQIVRTVLRGQLIEAFKSVDHL